MKINELIEKTGWQYLVEPSEDKEISGAYCGDLLSWVMGNGEPNQAWITVQAHLNVIAVAVLREFSCIILADGVSLDDDVVSKAKEENMCVIKCDLPVFEIARKLIELGI